MVSERVLIVDDEPEIRRAVRRSLAPAYDVVSADSGEACLEAVRNGFRGLLLVDIMMPSMSGWEAIQRMADSGLLEGNTICILSGLPDPDEGAGAAKSHVARYISKPFDKDGLRAVVAELAELHASRYQSATPGE